MRHTLLILFIFLNSIDLFSQSFKEVLSFHENGKPRTVSYKNENLELVKTNEYDDTGKLLSEFNYDPVTKLRNGKFFDINNKGFYDQGMLNCFDCTLIFGNESSSGFKWFGDFTNGKPRGEISIYKINKIQRLQYDPRTSYLLSYESKSRISYSSYVNTGETTEEFIMKLNYNENGELDGIVKPNNNTEIIFNNGFIEGIIKYEDKNRSYVKDSIFIENKIWKQNGSYVKNKGLPIFQYREFKNPTYVSYETINYDNFYKKDDTFVILDQNNENLLDNYGVFSIIDKVNTKSFNIESKNKIEFFLEDLLIPDNFRLVDNLFINILNNKSIDYDRSIQTGLNRIRNDKYSIEDDLINLYERILNKLSPFYFIILHSNFLKDEDVLNKYQSFIVNPKDYRWEYASIINFEGIVSILNDYLKFPTYVLYKDRQIKVLEIKKINLDLFKKELNRINNYKDSKTDSNELNIIEKDQSTFNTSINNNSNKIFHELKDIRPKLRTSKKERYLKRNLNKIVKKHNLKLLEIQRGIKQLSDGRYYISVYTFENKIDIEKFYELEKGLNVMGYQFIKDESELRLYMFRKQ